MRRSTRSAGWFLAVAAVWIVGIRTGLGAPTLTSIAIDGEMGDWATVLANPENIVHDGPGGGLPDADAPAQGTLNVDTVAFTWDATYLYLYVHRQATSCEFNHFWFHFDLDNDRRVADTSPLLSVAWRGRNRKVTTTLDAYRAADMAAGDPITNGRGLHDGYKLPGARAAGAIIETLNGGAPGGLEMEARIAWASLGAATGTAVQFHLSTSRRVNDYPGAIADTTGGTNAYAAVDLGPNRALNALPGSTLVMPHNVSNSGNVTDTFDLTWTAVGDFSPTLVNSYLDADASGTPTPGDTLLTDTNGNGLTDTGAMPGHGGSKAILAVASIPFTAVKGQISNITLLARSSHNPAVLDTAIDTVTINHPTITLLRSFGAAGE